MPVPLPSTLIALAVSLAVLAPAAHAQAPAPQATAATPTVEATPAPAAAPAPPAADASFTYDPDGRRDPFVSLMAGGSERRTSAPGDGLAGLAVDDLSVRGIVQTRRGPVAMVQGPDGRTYLARARDALLDGTITSVTPDGLVILQDVSDPLSLVKQREVRKLLRGIEEGK